MSPSGKKPTPAWPWFPGIVALFAVTAALHYDYTVDDTYILLRYARNFASGLGPVFNPGERVEGFTSPLWVAVLAAASLAHINILHFAKAGGAVMGVLVLLLTARAGTQLIPGRSARQRLLPVLLLAANASFSLWAVEGLETMPAALLLLPAFLAYRAEMEQNPARISASSLLMALAALNRPEAALLWAHAAAHRVVTSGRGRRLRGLLTFLPGVLPLAAYGAFRLAYYGEILPNTFYAKSSGVPFGEVVRGAFYAGDFARTHFGFDMPFLGIGAAAGIAFVAFFVSACPRTAFVRYLMQAVALWTLTVVYEGGDWMPMFRFFVPILPPLFLLIGFGMTARIARPGLAGRAAALLLAAHLACGLWVSYAARFGGKGTHATADGYEKAHGVIARWIAERAQPSDAVALMDVGLIGYRTGLPVIDISGLTDRAIAHSPGPFLNKRYDASLVLSREPRFVVLVNGFPADYRLHADPAFARRYCFRFDADSQEAFRPPSRYLMLVYERCR